MTDPTTLSNTELARDVKGAAISEYKLSREPYHPSYYDLFEAARRLEALDQPPEILFHGTCSLKARQIEGSRFLKPPQAQDGHVSFTDNKRIAATFAQTACECTWNKHGTKSEPFLLSVKTADLKAAGIEVFRFTSDWSWSWEEEREWAVAQPVPFDLLYIENELY